MLEEKIAVVTGASRGIGRAIAKELALKGAFVIVNYNGSKQAADETVNEITQAGGKAVGVQCNVADAAECEAFINNIISEYGRIDILVNNAGIVRDNLLMRISEKDFDAVIDTNLRELFIRCVSWRVQCFAKEAEELLIFLQWLDFWKCRTGKLCGIKGWCYRSYEISSKGTCIARHHRKCCSTRFY